MRSLGLGYKAAGVLSASLGAELLAYLLYPSSPRSPLPTPFYLQCSSTTLFLATRSQFHSFMGPIQIYAVAAGGVFLLLALAHPPPASEFFMKDVVEPA
jgi:hypothetical protein